MGEAPGLGFCDSVAHLLLNHSDPPGRQLGRGSPLSGDPRPFPTGPSPGIPSHALAGGGCAAICRRPGRGE